MSAERLGFIGAGNMAGAILEGILKGGEVAPDSICMADVSREQREDRARRFGVRVTDDNAEAVRDADWVVLAVKPQQVEEALETAQAAFRANQLVVSICAGVPTERLEGLVPSRVIRVMPNLPALAGAGVAAICAGRRATEADLAHVEKRLAATGVVVRVPEGHMDAVTALSGSGPGYVFAFMEALEAAGREMGFSEETARQMAIGTVRGAAELAMQSAETPAEWRRRVSSKGGTTLAGLAAMEEGGFTAAIRAGVFAARDRSAELAKG